MRSPRCPTAMSTQVVVDRRRRSDLAFSLARPSRKSQAHLASRNYEATPRKFTRFAHAQGGARYIRSSRSRVDNEMSKFGSRAKSVRPPTFWSLWKSTCAEMLTLLAISFVQGIASAGHLALSASAPAPHRLRQLSAATSLTPAGKTRSVGKKKTEPECGSGAPGTKIETRPPLTTSV